jgi:hypothetical protein
VVTGESEQGSHQHITKRIYQVQLLDDGGDAAIDYLLVALTDRSRAIREAVAAGLNVLKEEAQ